MLAYQTAGGCGLVSQPIPEAKGGHGEWVSY